MPVVLIDDDSMMVLKPG